jgi:hypothetical protein
VEQLARPPPDAAQTGGQDIVLTNILSVAGGVGIGIVAGFAIASTLCLPTIRFERKSVVDSLALNVAGMALPE